MAVTLQTQREMYGDRFVKGMRVVSVTMSLSATTDYSTTGGSEGIDMEAVKGVLGFGSIADVFAATWKQANGTLRPLVSIFSSENNRLRAFKGSAGPLIEIVPGTDLAAGDLLQLTVFGG